MRFLIALGIFVGYLAALAGAQPVEVLAATALGYITYEYAYRLGLFYLRQRRRRNR